MKIISLLFILAFPMAGLAQSTGTVDRSSAFKRTDQTVDVSVATNGAFSTVALSLNRLHRLGRSRRFRIGYGLRLTSAFGRDTDYKTAPSRLVKGPGKGSALGLFAKNLDENLDTLWVPTTQANVLNVSLHLEYALNRRVDVGFNIDLIRFTFGPNQVGRFVTNSPVRSSLSGTEQPARLTSFNILLGDQSDRGSLNSEAYVRYRFSDRISLRGGLSFIANEYTTDRQLTLGNDRFRSANLRGLVAVSYHF